MLEWVDRDVLVDVSINAVPVVILTYFVVGLLVWFPWAEDPLVLALTHGLTIVPIVVLVIATYYVSLAVERDARTRERND
jgi:hypothetical protein